MIYIFTSSTVMHPNDGSMTSSVCSSGGSSLASSVLGSAWSSRQTSRRTSVTTSPTRTPAISRTPVRRDSHYSPTATPANSPLLGGSPQPSPPSTPAPTDRYAPSLHDLIHAGQSMLRHNDSPLALQTPGCLYMGLLNRSPMSQLMNLKRTLKSPAAATTDDKVLCAEPPLGVPAQPGSGALEKGTSVPDVVTRRGHGGRTPRPRTDLGTVGTPSTNKPASTHSSPLGTLSSLLFGRKGGLL